VSPAKTGRKGTIQKGNKAGDVIVLRRVLFGGKKKYFVVGSSILLMETHFKDVIFNNIKQMTTRDNGITWMKSHTKDYKEQNLVRVWLGGQGHTVGHVLYRAILTRRIEEMTAIDIELEGFGVLGVRNDVLKGFKRPLTPQNFVKLVFGVERSVGSIVSSFLFYFFPYH
jgi:hypothetical protein